MIEDKVSTLSSLAIVVSRSRLHGPSLGVPLDGG
jgi:hypothetical protein